MLRGISAPSHWHVKLQPLIAIQTAAGHAIFPLQMEWCWQLKLQMQASKQLVPTDQHADLLRAKIAILSCWFGMPMPVHLSVAIILQARSQLVRKDFGL